MAVRAMHLHQLQWMVLTSIMTELGALIGQILPWGGEEAAVYSTLHVSVLFLLSPCLFFSPYSASSSFSISPFLFPLLSE